jgi:hypothetical protein
MLWKSIDDDHDLDITQQVQLEEACRAKDRLDRLDALLRGDLDSWLSIREFDDGRPAELIINSALTQANATANLMKQLLAALRLPDLQSGKKPQFRGPRGAQKPSTPSGVSSLDRARARKSGS